jgi:uncharacterized membrane protein YeaQ/YmgE (transglycosylase-associated protein family)
MVITFNGAPVHFDFDTILIWILVGLVAGFLARHLALGHGLGVIGDTVVGILGAVIGGFLAAVVKLNGGNRAVFHANAPDRGAKRHFPSLLFDGDFATFVEIG